MATTTGATSNATAAYWKGLRAAAPFLLVVAPFGMLFGVLATEAGLNIFETLTFSIAVIAGAAQFTALQLMQENAPTAVVLASALAVNLRMAMYSASLTPYIGAAPFWQRAVAAYLTVDQTYAVSVVEFEAAPDMPMPARIAFFFGCATSVCPAWYIFTVVGAVLGAQIPDSFALDFALPITFLALVTPMLRTPAHVVAAVVAIIASLLAANLPYSLGLIVAGTLGMMAGAWTETCHETRKKAART